MEPPGVLSPRTSRLKTLARKASVAGEQPVYVDDLDQFVMKEYFRFVPALAHHHYYRKRHQFVEGNRSIHFMEKHFVAAVLVDIATIQLNLEHSYKSMNVLRWLL